MALLGEFEKWVSRDAEQFLKGIGVKRGQYVLDFGCGRGCYSLPLAKAVGDTGKVFAFDRDEGSLAELKTAMAEYGLDNIELLMGDTKVPLEDNFLDFILCYDMLHYSKDRRLIYKEVYRLLKRGGIFSLYPKHCKDDYPLMELASFGLDDIIKEAEMSGFELAGKFYKRCLHDYSYNDCVVLNFLPKK